MGKVRWTEKASKNLQAIHDFISRDSKSYAHRFIKSLIKRTIRLEMLPYSGRIVPELESVGLREVIYRNYRIVYRVERGNEDIEILAVVHGAQDMSKTIRKEWEL